MSTDASWPADVEALQRQLLAAHQRLAHTESVLAETAVACEEQRLQIEKLRAELELFQRYLFGRRSERFVEDPGQGRLFDQPADGTPPTPELSAAAEEEITYRRRRASCLSICRGKKSCWTCRKKIACAIAVASRW